MCGRYSLAVNPGDVADAFDVDLEPWSETHGPRFNIAPGMDGLVVVAAPEGRRAGYLRWGLVPEWAKDPAIASRLINARSETVSEKPAFRDSFLGRRCLVPADGFYEWEALRDAEGRPWQKQPHWIHPPGGGLLAFAGIWATWLDPAGARVSTFSILTRDAPESLAWLHHRVPVLLEKDLQAAWLDPTQEERSLVELLGSAPHIPLETHPVSDRINRVGNDDPSCRVEVPRKEPPALEQQSLFME